jgi:corticosteroid 11-beta-dehydrogenase isozyme 1
MKASHVTIVARSEDKLNALREEMLTSFKEHDNDGFVPVVHVIPGDLSSREASERVIATAIDAMGGLDYLVLNHITNSRYGLWTQQPNHDFVEEMFDTNTLSYIWMANAALSTLQASGGQIVVVSSLAGYVGVPFTAVYAATKHALRGFFNALRTVSYYILTPYIKLRYLLCILYQVLNHSHPNHESL